MKNLIFLSILLSAFSTSAQDSIDRAVIKDIYTTALFHNQGYQWLGELTEIGGRLAGSPEADKAVAHFKELADSMGFETWLQEVKVPHWVRGQENTASFLAGGEQYEVNFCALGGSVGTGGNLQAEVLEVRSFEELDSLGEAVKGKIVFFNIPMDPSFINTFFAYSRAVKQRWAGALEASKHGAVAVVARSLSSTINDIPHTGSMTYKGAPEKIPAISISTADSEKLSEMLKKGTAEFQMQLNCEWRDSLVSHNLIADLKGSEKPDEIILVGGHIDSWDLGDGAHDDGAGCIHSLESAWLLKKLNLLPKRTLRVVFFMNEEFGLSGARVYANYAKDEQVHHAFALESDAGGFSPRGISIVASEETTAAIKDLRDLLEPYGIHQFSQSGSGADIGQLYRPGSVLLGLRPDSHRYFEIHHTKNDVLERVNPRELEMGSASIAAFIYLLDKYDLVSEYPVSTH